MLQWNNGWWALPSSGRLSIIGGDQSSLKTRVCEVVKEDRLLLSNACIIHTRTDYVFQERHSKRIQSQLLWEVLDEVSNASDESHQQ